MVLNFPGALGNSPRELEISTREQYIADTTEHIKLDHILAPFRWDVRLGLETFVGQSSHSFFDGGNIPVHPGRESLEWNVRFPALVPMKILLLHIYELFHLWHGLFVAKMYIAEEVAVLIIAGLWRSEA
mmetsp:Transcript_41393/g.163033  ORF Transcript_41393/g.163033 Transcript_41393/m.163033 type:complete len:129 (+) Transcript_41393:860-1246(+)